MLNLIELELRKINSRHYLWSALIISLCMLGFVYTFSMIAYIGSDIDAKEFSSYYNIILLTNALNTTAFSILAAVMFSRFVINDYSGKKAILVLTYPIRRTRIFAAKIIVVATFLIGFMILETIAIGAVWGITESIFPLVPDKMSLALIGRALRDTILLAFLSAGIGIISLRIGFTKNSAPTCIVTAVIISSCIANVIAMAKDNYIPLAFVMIVVFISDFLVLRNLVKLVNGIEV